MKNIANPITFEKQILYPSFASDITFESIVAEAKASIDKKISIFLEATDREIYASLMSERRENRQFKLIGLRSKTLLTTFGVVTFRRRYYKDLIDGRYFFPLDMLLSFQKYRRYTDDLPVRVLELASRMTYSEVGRSAVPECALSKSTVFSIIKRTEVAKMESPIAANKGRIHIQIDEKYVSIYGKRHKSRLYTATIFKGVSTYGKGRRRLLNVCYASARTVSKLAKRINSLLIGKYGAATDDEAFLSGDYATYIQRFPERITACRAVYVPDKFHTMRAMKEMIGRKVGVAELGDKAFLDSLIEAAEETHQAGKYQCSQVYNYVKNNESPYAAYFDPDYEGCSQECTNSHVYAVRFGKHANRFKYETLEKLALIREAISTHGSIVLKSKAEPKKYEEISVRLGGIRMEKVKSYLNLDVFQPGTRKVLDYLSGTVQNWC